MDKLKYIKFEESQGQYTNSIPIGVDSKNVDLKTGYNLEEVLGQYDLSKGTIEERLDLKTSICITPEMFGAIGDGVVNDTNAIQTCIDYAYENNKTIIFSEGKNYGVTSILIKNALQSIDFHGCVLKGLANNVQGVVVVKFAKNDLTRPHGYIKNLIIDMNVKASSGLYVDGARRRLFDSIVVTNPPIGGIGINHNSGNGCTYNNIRLRSQQESPSLNTIGIYVNTSDNTFNNIDFTNFVTGIKTNGFETMSNIHGFINQASIYPESIFMDLGGGGLFSNLYPDTQHIAIKLSKDDIAAVISNIILVFNENSIGEEIINEYPPFFMNAHTYFMRRIVINGLSINSARYDINHMLNEDAKFALFVNGMVSGSQNAAYNTLTKIGYEAVYANPNCTFDSAKRNNMPILFADGYRDTIIALKNISETSIIARFSIGYVYSLKIGAYPCIIKNTNDEYRTAILNVTKTETNPVYRYLFVLGGVSAGETIYVDIPTQEYFVTQQE